MQNNNSGQNCINLWIVLILVIILIPINSLWIIQTELVHYSAHPTTMSLLSNVIFLLFLFICINLMVSKIFRRYGLNQRELLFIYILLSTASTMSGHDMIQVLAPMLGHAFWFATPENEWKELFWRYIPRWLAVDDMTALKDYYHGESTLYTIQHVKAWAVPILWWSAFYVVLVAVMLCINVIIRRQWTEHEKLSYPIIRLPLEMTRDYGRVLFQNRLLWIGFAISGFISLVNGLHFIYPLVPEIHVRHYDLSQFFVEKPWNAMGRTRVTFYPFAIGMGFFIPLDLSFSYWFFYWLGKMEMVVGSALGLHNLPDFPYMSEQAFGGCIGIFIMALWAGRTHFRKVLDRVFRNRVYDDRNEPLSYPVAVLGIALGILFLLFFSRQAGMSVWVAILFFAGYFILSLTFTRLRAELGPPIISLWVWGERSGDPGQTVVKFLGTRRLGPVNLTMLSFFFWFNRDHRAHPMPHQLEGFELSNRAGMNLSKLVLPIILVAAISSLTAFWAYLHIFFKIGGWGSFAWEPFNRLRNWLYIPRSADVPAIGFTCFGWLFTTFLMLMRRQFIWWPFHPAGYVLSGTWSADNVWMCLLISWLVKLSIIKYGGISAYRRAVPFFLGLILGQFVIGSLWSILGVVLDVPIKFYFI